MYLIDTDIVSNLLRRQPSIHLIRKFATIPAKDQSISTITLGELLYGAHRSVQRENELVRAINERLVANLTVLPFDSEAARAYGRVRATLEKSGVVVAEADLRIASTALSRNLTVVTANTRHFQRIPDLAIENWLDPT
jgi:tRNA(fMet)-specific endonuclease VapC